MPFAERSHAEITCSDLFVGPQTLAWRCAAQTVDEVCSARRANANQRMLNFLRTRDKGAPFENLRAGALTVVNIAHPTFITRLTTAANYKIETCPSLAFPCGMWWAVEQE